MERIFGAENQDQTLNQLLLQLKSDLLEKQAAIDKVYFRFVFLGDPDEAERSKALESLREDLEAKRYLIHSFFERDVSMVIEFRSAHGKAGPITHKKVTYVYPLEMQSVSCRVGPNGEQMNVGFVRLVDLHGMYKDMGQTFFQRNIRSWLSEKTSVNRSILNAFRQIILMEQDDPSVLAFHHNGMSLSAEQLERTDTCFRITEPKLLNGAQTITTFDQFLSGNHENPRLKARDEALRNLWVLCKIITQASANFITTVTVNNNRQNPVKPWNLRANDLIQLELQDKFCDDLGIYYERQEKAFKNMSDEDLEKQRIKSYKAIELYRLAQTFLISDGEVEKLSRMPDVFENEKLYTQVFSTGRLKADSRKIVLCYKVQFRLRRLINEILDKGRNRYAYIAKARNLLWALLCQGILNDSDLEHYADQFGCNLSLEADYTSWLAKLASTRCRFLLSQVASEPSYAKKITDRKFDFLRTNAVFKRCMEVAYDKWKWLEKRLK